MFTGIVQALGIVLVASEADWGRRLTVSLAELADAAISPGDSVCVSGVCLTVVKKANGSAHFDVVSETLRRSTLGSKRCQDRVNLELSLRGDSFIGGHFVQGHVDGIGTVSHIQADGSDWRITIQAPAASAPCIIPKGSIAVDGVSMTIADIASHGAQFTLAVIPTTLEKTTFSGLKAGDQVNLETDILARTVVHYLRQLNGTEKPPPHTRLAEEAADSGISLAKLRDLGFV